MTFYENYKTEVEFWKAMLDQTEEKKEVLESENDELRFDFYHLKEQIEMLIESINNCPMEYLNWADVEKELQYFVTLCHR